MCKFFIFAASLLGLLALTVACESDAPESDASESITGGLIGPDTRHWGKTVASLEERIYLADVVVKARLTSAGEDALNFRAIEYLKGTGPNKFAVKAETEGRSTQWDDQNAILFLTSLSGEAQEFAFADTTNWVYVPSTLDGQGYTEATTYTGDLPAGYTVGTRNPVWLPTGETASSTNGAARSAQVAPAIITEYGKDGSTKTVTQTELEALVQWTIGPPATGGRSRSSGGSQPTVEQFNYCMVRAMSRIRRMRDREALYGPRDIYHSQENIASGAGRGVKLIDWPNLIVGDIASDGEYDREIVHGRDAHLFESRITDDDNNPRNGYSYAVETSRPLPAGTYTFKHTSEIYYWAYCNYSRPNNYFVMDVNVTAPPGTVHEAFFDPATTTAGVGYLAGSATTTGVLEPAGFSMRGRDINLTGLEWRNGQVVLSFDRTVQLSDGLSFIETDGTAGLYLSQYDATEDLRARTVTWDVSEQPWESGDELMLRIGPIPLPAVRNVTAERGSDGEVVLSWEVEYTAGVNGYRIWRYLPWRDDAPRVYVADTLSTDTTYTDVYGSTSDLAEYSVQAIGRGSDAGERSEGVPVGSE